MKGEFYRMEYEAWDEGTDELTLEQEGAYLRLCHQMYRRRGSIPSSPATLARIWRCHPNKAAKILADLIAAGKVVDTDGVLTNNRVTSELDARGLTSGIRADAGRTGGIRSGETRRKSLKSNDPPEANASTKRREEKRREEESVSRDARDPPSWPDDFQDQFERAYPRVAGDPVRTRAALSAVRDQGVQLPALLSAAGSYGKATEARFVCNPDRWLSERRFRNEPAFKAAALSSTADIWVRQESDEGHAWEAHERAAGRMVRWIPSDKRGVGRSMPSRWPPGHAPPDQRHEDAA